MSHYLGLNKNPRINSMIQNVMIQRFKNDKKQINTIQFKGETSFCPHKYPIQDDSKWQCLIGIYRRLGGIITTNGLKPT